jgi:sulfonate transport system substrate-binding protein
MSAHHPIGENRALEEIMRLFKFGLGLLCATALIGTGAAQAADPVRIRLSYVVPIANWASMLVEKKDLAKNLGKSYQLEITRFAGTPPQITALAAGELEIANLTYPDAADRHPECRHE